MTGNGRFFWNELLTPDVEAAKSFYTHAAGWTYENASAPGGPDYIVAAKDGRPVCGLMAFRDGVPAGTPAFWLGYIEVENVDAAVVAAVDAGGQVMMEPMDVEGVGRLGWVTDPHGARLGLIAPVPGLGGTDGP